MRYAIYFLPEGNTPLWRFGSSVIGYDSISGRHVEHPTCSFDEDLAAITVQPRTYGFHATLKAPFRLSQTMTEEDLLAAAQTFSAQERPFSLGALSVEALGSFIALVPEMSPKLESFAARCVEAFEPFRSPMNTEERAKRLRSPLTPRQIELMDAYGYPYVMDEFRFHMTLTSSLAAPLIAPVRMALAGLYEPVAAPLDIWSICVCAQAPGQKFRLLRRLTLAQAS